MDPSTSAQDVMRCDLCETAVVQMHCDSCLINLCKACVGEHSMSEESSKKHEIVQFKYRKSTPLYPGCASHDKERCEMYCNQCDVPICSACISFEAHSGHKICQMLTFYNSRKEEIERENEEMKTSIYPTYQDIVSDVQNRMSQLEKEYRDLSTAITKHGDVWHRTIDEVVKHLQAEVDTMKSRHSDILKKHIAELNQKISEIDDEIQASSNILESNDISILLHFNRKITEFRKLPSKLEESFPHFTPMQCQQKEILKQFGKLSTLTLSSDEHGYSIKTEQKSSEVITPQVKQLLKNPKTVTIIDTGYDGYLRNVACVNDDEIWTSGGESNVKSISISRGSLLKSITTMSGNVPHDIAVTKHGHLVYTDPSDKTVNIVKNEEIETLIRLQNWRPRNVCSTSTGDLLVVMDSNDSKQSKVVRYSGSTEKQSIQFDDDNKPLYSSGKTKCISENKNLDICVADWAAKAVVVVNQAGKLRFRYTGHTPAPWYKPFSPAGITTDSQSHILTADFNNYYVHIIDQDGQFLTFIDCELNVPFGLCTDTYDNLFVAQFGNKKVMKIKYFL